MTSIILDLAVGSSLDVADASEIAAAAHDAGVTAVRLLDGATDEVLDPTAVAAYLAGRIPALRWIVEAPTTHNAPYNLARRVLSLDRATAGRSGLVLRTGDGDEVSEAAVPDRQAAGRQRRWAEYARVLTGLWESFPAAALLGDQAEGVFADTDLIKPISHEGSFYRVAGPLDGPSSPQGRPVLVADARDELDWADAAALADVLIVSRQQAPAAAARLAAALERVGRRREEVALLGRADLTGSAFAPWTADELADWSASHALDGLELVIGGNRTEILGLLRALGPWPRPAPEATLRTALGLPELVGASA
jgi:alkanesulfonate monooxygenase SsuD/methylene tetrahydromethanopterin reductase-like flavin-dependent oxidoreductase (luciferase family)